jgi:hypothetical protein
MQGRVVKRICAFDAAGDGDLGKGRKRKEEKEKQ